MGNNTYTKWIKLSYRKRCIGLYAYFVSWKWILQKIMFIFGVWLYKTSNFHAFNIDDFRSLFALKIKTNSKIHSFVSNLKFTLWLWQKVWKCVRIVFVLQKGQYQNNDFKVLTNFYWNWFELYFTKIIKLNFFSVTFFISRSLVLKSYFTDNS